MNDLEWLMASPPPPDLPRRIDRSHLQPPLLPPCPSLADDAFPGKITTS